MKRFRAFEVSREGAKNCACGGGSRFYKGDPNNDIQPVSKEALIGAIKKCHLNNCE